MSHKYQHKKRNSSDTSDSSASSSEVEKCSRGDCYDQSRACIVCPPCDYKEKYDSSGSDYSCPDFSDLCEDKARICCEKKDFYKKSRKDRSDDCKSSDSSESCDNDYHELKSKKCRGCDRGCGSCNNCRSCGCRECSDYSRSSVINALGSSESENDCVNFDRLACDEKRKCGPLFDQCKRKDNYLDDSTKDATKDSSCDKKDDGKRYNYTKRNGKPDQQRRGKRNDQRKVRSEHNPLVKEESSSASKEESASGNKQVSSSSSSASSSSSRGKKFVVSFGPKEGHQWAKYNESDESIHINGKNGPVLHLYRGSTYFFCVEQSNVSDDSSEDAKHFFFLTDSPAGGIGSHSIQGGFAPVSKGCICFKVDKCTPRYFFYQSSRQAFEGGLVIVHDK